MRKTWKRRLAGWMAAVMLLSALPMQAFAAVGQLVGNSAVENAALLQALEAAYGEDAETYLALLDHYGLLDEDGNLITDEKIVVDGVEYTLEELEEYLSDPSVDLSKVAEVDGQYITLENLKLVLEIEQYLAYVKATYFSPQDLTDAQKASFYDLAGAWASGGLSFEGAALTAGGIGLLSVESGLDGAAPSGIDHGVRVEKVEITGEDPTRGNPATKTLTVTLDKAQKAAVTMAFRPLPGIAEVSAPEGLTSDGIGGYVLTIPEGDTSVSVQFQVSVPDGVEIGGWADYYVQLYNLENALFDDNGTTQWQKRECFEVGDTMRYAVTETVTMPAYDASGDYAYQVFSGEKYYEDWLNEQGLSFGAQPSTASKTTLSSKTISISEWDLSDDEAGYTYDVKLDSFPVRRKAVLVPTTADGENELFWGDGSWWDNGEYKYAAGVNPELRISATVGQTTESKDYGLNQSFVNFQEADAAVDGAVMIFPCEDTTGASDSIQIDLQSSVGFYDLQHIKGAGQPHTYLYFLPSGAGSPTVTITAKGRTQTVNVTSVRAPAGTYFPGQWVPITVQFDYPVDNWPISLHVNGNEFENLVTAQPTDENSNPNSNPYSERQVFCYTVTETDAPTVSIYERSDIAPAANETGSLPITWPSDAGEPLDGVTLTTNRADAFTSFTLTQGAEAGTNLPQVTVTATLNRSDAAYTDWMSSDLQDGTLNALYASVDGGKTPCYFTNPGGEELADALTVTIPLDYNTNTDGEEDEYQVELWLQGEDGKYRLLLGEGGTCTVAPAVPVEAGDMHPTLTVGDQTYGTEDTIPTIYAQDAADLTLSFTLDSGNYTWGDAAKVGYFDKEGVLHGAGALQPDDLHFAWKSSDNDIATVTVDEKGAAAVSLTGSKQGKVKFTLVALNGGADTEDAVGGMADAESAPISLTVGVGEDPYLSISNQGSAVTARQGSDAVVSWSSNLCLKNGTVDETTGELVGIQEGKETTFHISAYYKTQNGAPVQINLGELATLTTSAETPSISSVTLPWKGLLDKLYETGVREITVQVYADYGGKRYGTYDATKLPEGTVAGDTGDRATATVTMVSQPASVALE